ncbi:MAG: ArsB/NhaD family transporter [Patescibacteria group bacterium]|nr:ArsB/NhaD family transporter [Patescibacteria group bacterium]
MESVSGIIPPLLFLFLLFLLVTDRFNRSIITALFAIFFVIFNFINFEKAVESIDFNTIGLLVGMMIIVSVIAKTGIFQFLAIKMLKLAKGRPVRLMIYLSLLTAFLSAFLDNVTTILLVTPVTLYITKILGVSPFPIVISLIYFSNIGGTATLIGDPPNIIIGSEANLTFNDFLKYNTPVTVINTFIILSLLFLIFKNQLRKKKVPLELIKKIKEERLIKDKVFTLKAILILVLVLIGFVTHSLTHIENSIIALSGAFLILLLSVREPDEIYKEIEWSSIFFLISLFVIMAAVEQTGFLELISNGLFSLTKGNVELNTYLILLTSGLSSSITGNLPNTLLFIKIIEGIAKMGVDVFPMWWALSLGACFGGNASLIASAVNIVGADIYNKNILENGQKNSPSQKINFINFSMYGSLVTLVSLLVSFFYLKVSFFN